MNRLESLIHFFGQQGGTIHDIAKKTGVDVSILLSGEIQNERSESSNDGWWLHRTCDKEYRVNKSKEYFGDSDFWLSVAAAGKIPFYD